MPFNVAGQRNRSSGRKTSHHGTTNAIPHWATRFEILAGPHTLLSRVSHVRWGENAQTAAIVIGRMRARQLNEPSTQSGNFGFFSSVSRILVTDACKMFSSVLAHPLFAYGKLGKQTAYPLWASERQVAISNAAPPTSGASVVGNISLGFFLGCKSPGPPQKVIPSEKVATFS